MRAVVADGGRLEVRELPDPVPGPGEVVLRVRAAGLNRADLAVVRGAYVVGSSVRAPGRPASLTGRSSPPAGSSTESSAAVASGSAAPPPPRPQPMGGEAAGEVVAVGPGVRDLRPGDRVMAMCRGAFAELARVETGRSMLVPDRLSWAEAGAAPITFVTAHDALLTAGRLTSGGSVLVNAASSGVGVAALQLARLLGAGTVLASSTSAAKLGALAAAGVSFDVGLVAGDAGFADRCLEATAGAGVDVIVDNVGGTAWPDNLAVAALGARIVSVGRLGGERAEVNLDELARKRVSLVGVTFRTRSADQAAAVFARAAADILPAFADGRVRVLVDRTFPLEEAAAAEDQLHANRHVGKLVLVP